MAASQLIFEGSLEKKFGKGKLGASFKRKHVVLALKDGKLCVRACVRACTPSRGCTRLLVCTTIPVCTYLYGVRPVDWHVVYRYIGAKDHKGDKTAKHFLEINEGTRLEMGRSEKGKFRFDVTTPTEVAKAMTCKHGSDRRLAGAFQLCAETEVERAI